MPLNMLLFRSFSRLDLVEKVALNQTEKSRSGFKAFNQVQNQGGLRGGFETTYTPFKKRPDKEAEKDYPNDHEERAI